MLESTYASFVDAPVGRYTNTGSGFVWCDSPTLCGAFLWGQPLADETRRILHVFDQYQRHMSREFSIVLDTRAVDRVDASSLELLVSWLLARRDALRPSIRMQASVIREGPVGFLLTGILPVVGHTHPYRIFTDPSQAFRAVDADRCAVLCAEVESIADRIRGVPRELQQLRTLLGSRIEITPSEASRVIGTSPRSLQRVLARQGSSFHREVSNARFALAQQLLHSTDHKLVEVSARVGISERSLTSLFRAKTGLTPAEWRKQHRG